MRENKENITGIWSFNNGNLEILIGAGVLIGLYIIGLRNYLLFHSLVEIFSIVVAYSIFAIFWNSRRFVDNDYLVFIGTAHLFIGAVDLLHTLVYKGMGIFPNNDANLPTQLWIAARYLQSLTFLIAPLLVGRKSRANRILGGYIIVTLFLLASIFWWGIFPDCYIAGQGLTRFKIISEYIISLIFFVSALLLWQKRAEFQRDILRLLLLSIAATILGELAFTRYISVYGVANLFGHFFKLIAFYLIYKAIIEIGLNKPYALLFRDLRKSEDGFRRERDFAENLINTAQVIVLVLNPAGEIMRFNPYTKKILGYEEQEVVGKNWFDVFLPRRERTHLQDLFEIILGDKRTRSNTNPVITKDGRELIIEWSNTPLTDSAGAPLGVLCIGQDITEQETVMAELSRLATVVEQATDTIVITNLAGTIIYANPALERSTGYRVEDALGQNPRILKSGHHDAAFYKELWGTISSGETWYGTFVNKRKDGSFYYEEATIFPIKDASGKKINYAAVKRDITERKRVQEQLQRQNAFLKTILDSLTHPFYVINAHDCTIKVANSAAEVFGKVSDTITCHELTHKTAHRCDTPKHPCPLEEVKRTKNPVTLEHIHYDRDGNPCYVEVHGYPIFDDAGDVVQMIEYSFDITDRKRAEKALSWEAGVNAAIAELSKALISSASLDDISYLVLEHAKQLTSSKYGFVGYIDIQTGYLVSTTMTRDIWETCQVPNKDFVFDEFTGLWGWVLNNKQPLMTNAPANDARSTGIPQGHVPIERFVSAPATIDEDLVGTIALANPNRDYKERDLELVERLASLYAVAVHRQRADNELAERTKELARSNTDLQQFAYVVSHDLQEPLRMVSNYMKLLERRYKGQLDEDADEFIFYAVDGAQRMQRLIKDLLKYSRVDTRGKEFAAVDCEKIFQHVLHSLQLAIEDSDAEITHDPLPTISGDETQLEQLFQNLISNAIKFRGDEAPRVHISAEERADDWLFSVRDNGIGIDPKHAERIFVIFQRLHARDKYEGTGIGLAICKKIVERHGGQIWVESEPGAGATFCFTIPK